MIRIDHEKCIGCGLCKEDCNQLNIEVKDGKAIAKKECFQCGHCVAICPKGAVSVDEYDMEDVIAKGDVEKITPEQYLGNIKLRRSVRNYKNQKITRIDLERLIQAGRYTATAKNNQDCHFIVVQEDLEQLKTMVWEYIDELEKNKGKLSKDLIPFLMFNRRRKKDKEDDYLFRNAPTVLLITSEWPLDSGLAAQNIENMAVCMDMGALYNGYLCRIINTDEKIKAWLGIEKETVKTCMLLGYPKVQYVRSAPRREARISFR